MYRNKKGRLSKFWWDQRVFIVFQDLTVCGASVASAIFLAVRAVKTVRKKLYYMCQITAFLHRRALVRSGQSM